MLNSSAFRKTKFSSHQVGILTFLIHEVQQPGVYVIRVLKGEKLIGEIGLSCSEDESNTNLNVDLATRSSFKKGQDQELVIKPNGRVGFYCSKGSDEFTVSILQKSDDGQETTVFDSEKLGRSDQFVINPIIAGDYSLTIGSQVTPAQIKVLKETEKPIPASQLDPVHGVVEDFGLNPTTVEIAVGQPLVLVTAGPPRFEIALVKPS